MSAPMSRIVHELEERRNRDGKIFPSEVVQWARVNPKSALHEYLEWDDSIAAERYRHDQVRTLLQVHLIDPQGHRRFVSLSIDRINGGGYRPLSDVMKRQDLRQIMLMDALADLERMQRLYEHLKELGPVWQEAGKARAKFLPRRAA